MQKRLPVEHFHFPVEKLNPVIIRTPIFCVPKKF